MAAQVDPTVNADSLEASVPQGQIQPSAEFEAVVRNSQGDVEFVNPGALCAVCLPDYMDGGDGFALGEAVTEGRKDEFPGIGENDRRSMIPADELRLGL